MSLTRDDARLVEALRAYSKRSSAPEFPFDSQNFTLWMAADRIEQLSKSLEEARETSHA